MNIMMARSMPPTGITYPEVNPVLTSGRVVCVAPSGSYEYDDGEEHATRGYHVPRGEPYLLLYVHYGAERDERSNVDEEIKPENNDSKCQAGVALKDQISVMSAN